MVGLGMGDVDLKNNSMTCVGALAQNEWLVREGFKVENGFCFFVTKKMVGNVNHRINYHKRTCKVAIERGKD